MTKNPPIPLAITDVGGRKKAIKVLREIILVRGMSTVFTYSVDQDVLLGREPWPPPRYRKSRFWWADKILAVLPYALIIGLWAIVGIHLAWGVAF